MTQLDCNVTGCMHNKENCCCKNEIEVQGNSATIACNTRCGSFDKKREDSYSNVTGETAKKATDVACQAKNCVYNEEGYCEAGHIGIVGSSACSSDQTECGSFKRR